MITLFNNFKRIILFCIIDMLLLFFVKKGSSECVVIISVDLFGDYIISRSFFQSFRDEASSRNKKLVLCASVQVKELINAYDNVFDQYIWTNRQGLHTFKERFRVLYLLKKLGAELAISLQRDPFINDALVFSTLAKQRVGTYHQKSIYDFFYSKCVHYNQIKTFEFNRYKLLLKEIYPSAILPKNTAFQSTKKTNFRISLKQDYLLLMPGSNERFKEWSAILFAETVAIICNLKNLAVIISGTNLDKCKASEIKKYISFYGINFTDLCGETSLHQLISIASNATIGLTNDSGGIHLLAALNRPGVAVSNTFSFGRFHPYPYELNSSIKFVYPEPFYKLTSREREELQANARYYNINEVRVPRVVEAMISLLDKNSYSKDVDLLKGT